MGQRFDQVTSAKAASQAAADGTRPSSIVGAARIATDALHAGVGDYLYILIVINIFVGIFNLFPMLPLDGGHVAIAVYEKIRTGRRKVPVPRRRDQADARSPGCSSCSWPCSSSPAFLTDILHPMANPFG